MKRNAVYQRTENGREEIRRKTHGLTQSERLVLILVDGVTDSDTVRSKLKGLSDERFGRALTKLVRNHLVQEVLMPIPGQGAETVDDSVADLFLRQDALDPVTVISADPEDEYDSTLHPLPATQTFASSVSATGTVDLHLWKVKTGTVDDPFPLIRTESRIVPPTDIKPMHQPIGARTVRKAEPQIPAATGQPTASQGSTASAVRLSATRDSESYRSERTSELPQQSEVKGGFLWLFWVVLTLLSVMTAGFVLFY